MSNNKKRECDKHPSYATMGFYQSTVGGSGVALFGSTLRHSKVIRMEIKEADRTRDLNREWIFGSKTILSIDMSYNQFAEVITSINNGTGIPVTLTSFNGERIEECPYTNERALIEEEFRDEFRKLSKTPREIIDLINNIFEERKGKSIRKQDLSDILSKLARLEQNLDSNIPYMRKAVNEMIDKGIKEAKHEIEAAISMAVNRAGVEAIGSDVNKLLEIMSHEENNNDTK